MIERYRKEENYPTESLSDGTSKGDRDIPELLITTAGPITIARCSGKSAFHWVWGTGMSREKAGAALGLLSHEF